MAPPPPSTHRKKRKFMYSAKRSKRSLPLTTTLPTAMQTPGSDTEPDSDSEEKAQYYLAQMNNKGSTRLGMHYHEMKRLKKMKEERGKVDAKSKKAAEEGGSRMSSASLLRRWTSGNAGGESATQEEPRVSVPYFTPSASSRASSLVPHQDEAASRSSGRSEPVKEASAGEKKNELAPGAVGEKRKRDDTREMKIDMWKGKPWLKE